jgi:hypothetical protein
MCSGWNSATSALCCRVWQQDFTTAADDAQGLILSQIYLYKMLVSNTVPFQVCFSGGEALIL